MAPNDDNGEEQTRGVQTDKWVGDIDSGATMMA